ncbi:hypothetical protein BC938DRAFT_474563 [Jimgerdemannia flammicorona]|uniref:Uncharacterized protein n=1 Tax=Jimgerdemannia flammicorona TaxID=994334 RepID=A0A433Q230_9FUNG|nr:hypothetical protein BC938DRAFT_474563 [Jimgerdemannia flammicorona]
MAKLQKEIETKDEACKKNLKEISDLKAERKEENSKARAAEKEKFKAEKEKFKAEKDGLQAEVNALQTDKENAEQKIMELELDNTLMRDALDNSKQDFDKLQCELDEWKANTTSGEVQQLQDQTRRLEGEKRQTQKHVERLNQLVEDLREQLSRANGDLETQAPEKETLKAQNNTLTKELDAAKSMITKLKAQAQKGKGKVTEVSPPPPANDHLDAIHAELQAAKNIINKQKGEIAALKRAKDGFDGEGGEALRTEVELLRQENEHLVKAKVSYYSFVKP